MNLVVESCTRLRAETTPQRFTVSRPKIVPFTKCRSRIRAGISGFLLLALLSPRVAPAQSLKPEEIYQKLLPSVLTLHVENAGESYVGTAFLALDKNAAVTAWHVVSDAVKVSAKFSDGQVVNVAKLIDKDETHDLALIQLDSGVRPRAALNVNCPPVGSRAYVIGAPKGFEFSITDGLISQIQDIPRCEGIPGVPARSPEATAAARLVNDRGEVVSIAAPGRKKTRRMSVLPLRRAASRPLESRAPTRFVESGYEAGIAYARFSLVKTSEPQHDASELKHLLTAAGKHLSITVSDGDSVKKFEVDFSPKISPGESGFEFFAVCFDEQRDVG